MKFFDQINYPSGEDVKNIRKAFPAIKFLSIRQDASRTEYHDSLETFEQSFEISSWIKLLQKRLDELQFSYCILRFHFNKGIPDTQWKRDLPDGRTIFFPDFENTQTGISKFLFDYHAEYFFYQFFSAWDVLFKYLNCHYNLKIKEAFKNTFNKKVQSRLKTIDPEVSEHLSSLFQQFMNIIEMRNNMTHGFPPHKIDDRPIESLEGGIRQISLGEYRYKPTAEILADLEFLIISLSKFLPILQQRIDLLFTKISS